MLFRDPSLARTATSLWRSRHCLQISRNVRTQILYENTGADELDSRPTYESPAGLATPKQVPHYSGSILLAGISDTQTP